MRRGVKGSDGAPGGRDAAPDDPAGSDRTSASGPEAAGPGLMALVRIPEAGNKERLLQPRLNRQAHPRRARCGDRHQVGRQQRHPVVIDNIRA